MKTNKIHITKLYRLARAMKYDEFEANIAKLLDDVPLTVRQDNEYYLVNAKLLQPTTEEKSCHNCKYNYRNIGINYHDAMYCRDCRQFDRFTKREEIDMKTQNEKIIEIFFRDGKKTY